MNEGNSNAAQEEGSKVNVEKTYNDILAKREAKLAKDALMEGRAQVLTRHFLKSREAEEKKKLEKLAEFSQQRYEQSMKKVRETLAAENSLHQLVEEEKRIISETVQQKVKENHERQLQAQAEKREREKWKEARMLYEQMIAEERAKKLEENHQKKLNDLKESMSDKEKKYKESRENLDKKRSDTSESQVSAMKKVLDKRKALSKENYEAKHNLLQTVEQKIQQADSRRQEYQGQISELLRQHGEQINQKVNECLTAREQLRQDKAKQLFEKARQYRDHKGSRKSLELQVEGESGEEVQVTQIETTAEPPHRPHRRTFGTSATAAHRPTTELSSSQQRPDMSTTQKSDQFRTAKATEDPPRHEKKQQEHIEATMRAHKDYIRRLEEIREADRKMMVTKKFKSVADAALSQEDKISDVCSTRMRSLHNMYIGKGLKDSSTMSSASGASTARTPRREKHHSCGLCEREFPLEHLVGSALQKNLMRLRNTLPDSRLPPAARAKKPMIGAEESPRQALVRSSTMNLLEERPSPIIPTVSTKVSPGDSLYDHEVPLCPSCYHFVRCVNA